MSKKGGKGGKKGGTSSNFKLTAKIETEAEVVSELQLKKLYLNEKLSKKYYYFIMFII